MCCSDFPGGCLSSVSPPVTCPFLVLCVPPLPLGRKVWPRVPSLNSSEHLCCPSALVSSCLLNGLPGLHPLHAPGWAQASLVAGCWVAAQCHHTDVLFTSHPSCLECCLPHLLPLLLKHQVSSPLGSHLWSPFTPRSVYMPLLFIQHVYWMLRCSRHCSRCWGDNRKLSQAYSPILSSCVHTSLIHLSFHEARKASPSSGPQPVLKEQIRLCQCSSFFLLFLLCVFLLSLEGAKQEIELHNYKISQIKFHHCFWFLHRVCWSFLCVSVCELNTSFVW